MDRTDEDISRKMKRAWRRHERRWKDNLYVYAVVSRRSRGISVGVNLNPDKGCNFDCVYCQVDRTVPPAVRRVDLSRLAEELDAVIEAERNGSLYLDEPYDVLAEQERGIRDIAFSGDGEPTTFPRFRDAVELAAEARRKFRLDAAKLVLITDAAYLEKPAVREALQLMDENNGEVWAKLDAGTEEYFRMVNRPNVPFKKILDNILNTARVRPIVIQSLWFRFRGLPPPADEVEAYCSRLAGIIAEGGRLKTIQLYTVARDPSDPAASSLSRHEMDDIASTVRAKVSAPVEVYY